jgi:hypothetical protein
MANQAQITQALKVLSSMLSVKADASPDSVAEAEKALDGSLASFKKKPDDHNYLALIDQMKAFRRAVFEKHYANQSGLEPDQRKNEPGYKGPERRGTKAVASADQREAAFRHWCRTGSLPGQVRASTESLHERIAKALDWPLADVQSMSLAALRELVRPVDKKLADEISAALSGGSHLKR